ncbi:hypothetical protein Goarm_017280, partial [Gossypium armourianum]|nr:hypothetical protein [Gossypium armourianum]
MNYGGEEARFTELGSDTKEILIGMVDTKKRQMFSVSSIVSHIEDSKDSINSHSLYVAIE